MAVCPDSLPSDSADINIQMSYGKRSREEDSELRCSKASKSDNLTHPSSPFIQSPSPTSVNYTDLLRAVYHFNETLGKYPSVDKLSDTMLMHGFLTLDEITKDDKSHYSISREYESPKEVCRFSSMDNIHTIEPKVQSLTPFQSRHNEREDDQSEYPTKHFELISDK